MSLGERSVLYLSVESESSLFLMTLMLSVIGTDGKRASAS